MNDSNDPLAAFVADEGDAYGISVTQSLLKRLIETASPEAIVAELDGFLERLALLEMFLEEERRMEIDSTELKQFRIRIRPQLEKEKSNLAAALYGAVARREGG
jgi:hypothetical protein